jgi:hypothetical protein
MGISRGWRRGAAAAVAAVVLAMGCSSATAAEACDGADRAGGARHVLFIGNSLTYFNGLPYMFAALADSLGEPPPLVEEVAFPDFGLEQHWEDGRAARAIRDGCWDVVVLQQGPSSLTESRALLLDYTGRYDALIRARGGRPALLSAWPSQARQGDFDRAIESYALAAEAVDGALLPAATAWLQAWEREPGLALYADGLHPTRQGTWLAAAVAVARLYGRSPLELPAGVAYRLGDSGAQQELRLDDATARTLREAARAALERHPED